MCDKREFRLEGKIMMANEDRAYVLVIRDSVDRESGLPYMDVEAWYITNFLSPRSGPDAGCGTRTNPTVADIRERVRVLFGPDMMGWKGRASLEDIGWVYYPERLRWEDVCVSNEMAPAYDLRGMPLPDHITNGANVHADAPRMKVFGEAQEVKADGFYTSSRDCVCFSDAKYALAADGWGWDYDEDSETQTWTKGAGKVTIPDNGLMEANVDLLFVFSKTHDEVVAWFKATEYGKMMEEVYGA